MTHKKSKNTLTIFNKRYSSLSAKHQSARSVEMGIGDANAVNWRSGRGESNFLLLEGFQAEEYLKWECCVF